MWGGTSFFSLTALNAYDVTWWIISCSIVSAFLLSLRAYEFKYCSLILTRPPKDAPLVVDPRLPTTLMLSMPKALLVARTLSHNSALIGSELWALNNLSNWSKVKFVPLLMPHALLPCALPFCSSSLVILSLSFINPSSLRLDASLAAHGRSLMYFFWLFISFDISSRSSSTSLKKFSSKCLVAHL